MVVGLIDVDNWGKLKGCFPNLPLMKLSTHHKKLGDTVKWYDGSYCDLVYMSKVFSFSEEPFEEINAGKVIKGGGAAMQYLYRTDKRSSTKRSTSTYPTRSNTPFPITPSTELPTPPTVLCLGAVRDNVISVM